MKIKNLAPIALFVYNRYDHLKLTINHLKKNNLASASKLIVFSDGAKKKKDTDEIIKIRNFLRKVNGFKKITIIERNKNYGLSKNIIKGVNYVLKKYKKVIVIEDDLIVSRSFLFYMNTGLNNYKKNKKVASIHGYIYPIKNIKKNIKSNTFFIKGADCWGWATWSRAWSFFNSDGKKLLQLIKKDNKIKEFNFDNNYNYYQLLKDQVNKKNDSWAVRWYASCFVNNMYTLYPTTSLVKNIGIDKLGQNSKLDLLGLGNKRLKQSNFQIKKEKIIESKIARVMIEKFFKSKKLFKIKSILKNFFNV